MGTFTGYSSMCIARGWPREAPLLCCDVSAEWTAIGRHAWASDSLARPDRAAHRSGAGDLAGPARERRTSTRCSSTPTSPVAAYWAELVPRVRPGGPVARGQRPVERQIVDSEATDKNTAALRAFNDLVASDDRVETVVLTAFDGLTIARR